MGKQKSLVLFWPVYILNFGWESVEKACSSRRPLILKIAYWLFKNNQECRCWDVWTKYVNIETYAKLTAVLQADIQTIKISAGYNITNIKEENVNQFWTTVKQLFLSFRRGLNFWQFSAVSVVREMFTLFSLIYLLEISVGICR